MTILAVLLDLSPSTTFPEVEREVLSDIYRIAHSPLVSGAALDSVLAFFSSLVQADDQIATHVVPGLALSVENTDKPDANLANVAKCIGQVIQSAHGVAAGTIAVYSKHIKVCQFMHGNITNFSLYRLKKSYKAKSTSEIVLSLLILGELGRFM